ncbi:DNA damage response protein kinase DUN1 [Cytospora mali]|uniref:DNA damage response protein kinase DUN1 n=1 Tax=Cytospora mali TaxID=578113 RepID=A0A194W561_CYTMA|nr:DNA damage response protein kinase DUN1 [Valsa mali]
MAGVMPLIKAWCEHGKPFPCLESKIEDVHLLMPFAQYDFQNAPWPKISLPTRLALFRQLLEGLRNLHATGIMHRDISPKNSLILSINDSAPMAAICDFGKAIKGATGRNIHLGPPPFVAPEVWRGEGYTNAIDIFSLGLTMLHTFGDWRGAGPIDERTYKTVLERLARLQEHQDPVPEEFLSLLRSILSWDPVNRPTAEQALDHKVWRQQGIITATALNGSKRRSSDISSKSDGATGTSGGESGIKRMRRSNGQSPSSPPGSDNGEDRRHGELAAREDRQVALEVTVTSE